MQPDTHHHQVSALQSAKQNTDSSPLPGAGASRAERNLGLLPRVTVDCNQQPATSPGGRGCDVTSGQSTALAVAKCGSSRLHSGLQGMVDGSMDAMTECGGGHLRRMWER
jgi:hypothetical protein